MAHPSASLGMHGISSLCFCALLGGCDARFTAHETWQTPAEVRIAASFSGDERMVQVLAGDQPLQLRLGPLFDDGRALEIWLFAYTLDDLVEAHPGLSGRTAEEVTRLISPTFDASEGVELPEAREVLRGLVSRDGPSEVAYERKSWSDWIAEIDGRRKPQLRLRIPEEVICGPISSMTIEGADRFEITGIAATSDDAALFSVGSREAGLRLGRIEGTAAREVAVLGPDPGRARGELSWSPADRSVYGVSVTGRVFRLDELGVMQPLPEQPFHASEVSAGIDGAVLAVGPTTGPAAPGRAFWELHQTGWIERTDAVLPLIRYLHVVRAARAVAWFNLWVYYWDGAQWDAELHVPQFDEVLLDLAGDDQVMVAVGYNGFVRIRRSSERAWETPPLVEGRSDLHAAAALGRGRFIVAGQTGTAAVWNGRGWCRVQTGFSGRFFAASASPSGRSAFIAGAPEPGQTGVSTTIVRVSIPDRL